jgi:lipopolysaccharide export system permease protein
MKILDRYILVEFLRKWFAILAFLALVLLLKSVLLELTELLKEKPGALQVILLFAYNFPLDFIQVIPVSVILAVMFSIGAMAKRKEILAIHACGVSYTRLAVPLALTVSLITGGVLYCYEQVLPECFIQSRSIEDAIKNKSKKGNAPARSRKENITTKGKGDRFYTMKNYYREINRMEWLTITDLFTAPSGARTIQRRIDAESAEMVEAPTPANGANNDGETTASLGARLWRFRNVTVLQFDAKGKLVERSHYAEKVLPMEEDLNRFLATNTKEKELNYAQLREFVRIQGERSQGDYYRRLKTEMYAKLAFPFATFLLGMLGYTFAVRSSIRSLVFEFGMAIICVVLWYTFFGAAQRFGRMGFMPPFLAAWYGNILFAALLAWRFRDLERIPVR